MKLRVWIIALLITVLAIPVSSPVLADSEASGQGQFSIGNVAPQIVTITLYQSDENTIVDGSGNSMTPQTEYALKIVASDNNGYDDITSITVYIYRATDVTGEPTGTFDTQTEAIYQWTSGSGWTLSNGGASTTWTLETTNSRGPIDVTTVQGTWWLHFKPGKVATEADGTTAFWIIKVVVEDSGGLQDSKKNDQESGGSVIQYSMQWYGEIAVDSNDVPFNFNGVDLGSSNNPIVTPSEGYIDVYTISNGDYKINVKASDTSGANDYWVGQNNGDHAVITTSDPGAAQIRIKINSANDPSTAVAITPQSSGYTTWISSATGPTSDGNAASGDGVDNTAYMWLDVGSSGLSADTYVGAVFFQIANA